jgi:hypothetical protein
MQCTIIVEEAHLLRNTAVFEMSPYCRLVIGTQERKSRAMNGTNPAWQQALGFDLMGVEQVVIEVIDENFCIPDSIIGMATFSVSRLSPGTQTLPLTYLGERAGFVKIRCQLSPQIGRPAALLGVGALKNIPIPGVHGRMGETSIIPGLRPGHRPLF